MIRKFLAAFTVLVIVAGIAGCSTVEYSKEEERQGIEYHPGHPGHEIHHQ